MRYFFKILFFIFTVITTVGEVKSSTVVNIVQEKTSLSVLPNAYCANNSIFDTDPTGMFLTHYVDEGYNTLLQTDDGSDHVVMVRKKDRDWFMGNVKFSDPERLNSPGWNSFWTERAE